MDVGGTDAAGQKLTDLDHWSVELLLVWLRLSVTSTRIECMFESMDAGAVLEAARAAHHAQVWSGNDQLILATVWADLNPGEAIHPDQLELPGSRRAVRPGGDGTPTVNDLELPEFGAMLAKGGLATHQFVGDALDLRHRLPNLWAKITGYQVMGWQGRKIAQATRNLACVDARRVDAQVAGFAGVVPWPKLEDLVQAAILTVDPDRAERQAEQRRGQRGVWAGQTGEDGLKGLHARMEPADANRLYARIQQIADCLPPGGTADERRADALALLGNELQATELLARHRQPDLFNDDLAAAVEPVQGEEDPDEPVEESELHPSLRDQPAQPCFDSAVFHAAVERMLERLDPTLLLPTTHLTVHIAAETVQTGRGVCRVPGIAPMTATWVKNWLGHERVKVRPVIDLNDPPPPVDCYEIPRRHRYHALLLRPGSVFPWSTATRGLDLDHHPRYIPLMKGGPPGQTSVDALGPLARPEHRAVTHGGWQRRQPEPGTMIFRSPHDYIWITNHTGTHDLGHGTFANTIWTMVAPDSGTTELPATG